MAEVIVEGTPVDPNSVPPTKAFRLKAEKRHTHDGRAIKPGDVVELTASQAHAFRDKFDAVDGAPFRVRSAAEVKKAREAQANQPVTPQPQVEKKDGNAPPPAPATPPALDAPPANAPDKK